MCKCSHCLGEEILLKDNSITRHLAFWVALAAFFQYVQPFDSKCLVREQLLLDSTIFKHPHRWLQFTFGLISFVQSARALFECLTYCVGSKWTNFFHTQMFRKYWMYAGPTNAHSCLNITYRPHVHLAISACALCATVFGTTTDFKRRSESRLGLICGLDWIRHIFDKQ